jgi:hypothetical protein
VKHPIPSTSLVDSTAALFDGRIAVEWTSGRGEEAADLTISLGRTSLRLPKFAPFAFESSVGEMRPTIQLWESRFVGVLVGLRYLAVVRFSTPAVTAITRLYRTDRDDTGWYSIEAFGVDERQVLIYEGGLLAIDENGIIRWHRPKPWDDVCIAATGDELRFLSGDAGEYLVATSTGVATSV